jgi:hypothetical protein
MHGFIENKIYYKKEKESAKLRMNGGSWTLNLTEISQLINKHGGYPEKIRIITEKYVYEIDYVDAFRSDSFVKFLGGEMKLVIPIKSWKIKEA